MIEKCIDWGLIATMLGTGLGIVVFIYTYMRNFKVDLNSKIDEEIKSIREEISEMRQEFRQQTLRTDRLYEMFVDLLKHKNPKTDP